MTSEGPYTRYSNPNMNNPYGNSYNSSSSGYGPPYSSQEYSSTSSYGGSGSVPGYGGGGGGPYTMAMPQYNNPSSYGEDQVQ